jgi:FkbM family methyltransferase
MKKVIWDLGMHNGTDSLFYLQKGFKVIAIEANPYFCEYVKNKLSEYIISGQLIIKECAIYDHNGNIDFTINKTHDDWSSIDMEWNSKYQSETEQKRVQCRTLPSLYNQYGNDIYYMKIDLEGYDINCIRQLEGLKLPKYLSTELLTYNNISSDKSSSEIFFLLKSLGYNKFQLVDQSLNYQIKCPLASKEGEYVDFKFDGFSSGLFGKDLPEDKWVDMDKVLLQYLDYFYNKNHSGSWFDLHCCYA